MPRINHWSTKNFNFRRRVGITLCHQPMLYVDHHHSYKAINRSYVGRLVFVCEESTYRRSYSQRIVFSHNVESFSFGQDTIDRAPTNKDAIERSIKLGVNLNQHKTTTVAYIKTKQIGLQSAMKPWQ